MNVYDFDNTIYDGESAVDFYLFLLKRDIRLAAMLPKILKMLWEYKRCKITEKQLINICEKYAWYMFSRFGDMQQLCADFWKSHRCKIKSFYLKQQKEDDVILSAGWDLLLRHVCNEIGIGTVLASHIDLHTGKIEQLCFGKNKVEIFRKNFPNGKIDEFYTDSMNDKPMFKISNRIFLVKGGKVKELIV